jgi:hypothetical protein
MRLIVTKGVVYQGQIIVEMPINLPDGCEVTINLETLNAELGLAQLPDPFVLHESDLTPE